MINLRPDQLALVKSLLAKYAPQHEVRAFGSRVTGKAKPHSDLDLVVMTKTPWTALHLANLQEAFSESNLPFRVDVLDWAGTSEEFRRIIVQRYEVLQRGENGGES
jgi:uncharacterized protein